MWRSSHPVLPGGEFSGEGELHLEGTVSWARQDGTCTVLSVRVHPVGCGGDTQGRNELPLGLLICLPQVLVFRPVL